MLDNTMYVILLFFHDLKFTVFVLILVGLRRDELTQWYFETPAKRRTWPS